MKKSLFALAALGAFAGVAQAQSSVTLYGTVDAGVFNINNPSTSVSNASGMIDSAFASSIWGLKGSEDLGGGLKAIFNVEGDLSTITGNPSSQGMFRRATNVGLAGGFGSVELGLKISPFVSSVNTNFALGNNSITLSSNVAEGVAQFFTKNAITYSLPTMGGLNGQLQYGMGNQSTDGSSSGSVMAGRLNYTAGNLYIEAAGQKLNSGTTNWQAASSYSTVAPASGGTTPAYGLGTNGDQSSYFVGAKYKLGQFTVGAGWLSNTIGPNVLTATHASVAYQATPKLGVGINYAVNSNDSSLTNFVARYDLSARTNLYGMVNYAKVGNYATYYGNAGGGTSGVTGAYSAVWSESNINGAAAAANTNSTAIGVGIVHRF